MAGGQKKFGTFSGVFTPSILTILGVIMYLRLGWVVGSAGIGGAILIVLIAHIISISTGLSISSIATDKKIGAGGVYYVLSRSLGLPIGGAIGLTLFVGTALSIALYLVGFAESFNAYMGYDESTNGLRMTGSLALLGLTIIAFISTSVAIKTQFLILTAIAVSIVAIFGGHSEWQPSSVSAFEGAGSASMEMVFAVFFPAVTGFTAGIAMSGDLKDPKKSIPAGTIGAIAVGFIIYILLVIFIGLQVRPDILVEDNNILMKIALYAPAVVAGIWGATLSSALGGILGAPRILQAMSVDQITPRIFGRGVGVDKEPRNALLLTVLLAESGILIGELDLIARIVSMFYLAAYGFINISFFLERWASTDFNPSFKVSKWVGMVGFAATFAVMFKLDMLAMFAAFAIISGVYLWLTRKEIALGTGDVWQSVWSSIVKSGLKRMVVSEDHKRNWKPNVLLFSGASDARPHLLEFSKSLAGRAGITTNFDLIENKEARVLFPKHQQSIQDDLLRQFDIFGRRIEVQNVFKGIESIATTFGFSGLDPNTVLMGWAKNTRDPLWFAQMTQKLIDLDYNVLYLDYDKRWGFRKKEQIDIWFNESSNNPELMLHLAKFIGVSPDWRNANIRILVVNNYNVDRMIIESRVKRLLEEYRIQATIKVVNNQAEKKSFYEIMKSLSAEADLIFLGIPDIEPGEEKTFVAQTNDLVSVIGTTLLIKASSTFPKVPLGLIDVGSQEELPVRIVSDLIPLNTPDDATLAASVNDLDSQLDSIASSLLEQTFSPIQQRYLYFFASVKEQIDGMLERLEQTPDPEDILHAITAALHQSCHLSDKFISDDLDELFLNLQVGLTNYKKARASLLLNEPGAIRVATKTEGKNKKVPWKNTLIQYSAEYGPSGILIALREHSTVHYTALESCKSLIENTLNELLLALNSEDGLPASLQEIKAKLEADYSDLTKQINSISQSPMDHIRNTDRIICNRSIDQVIKLADGTAGPREKPTQTAKQKRAIQKEIDNYAEVWTHHQELFHRQFNVGLRLERVAWGVKRAVEEAVNLIHVNYIEELKQHITDLQKALPALKKKVKSGKVPEPPTADLSIEEENTINSEFVSSQMTNTIGVLTDSLPEETELMDAESVRVFPALEQGRAKEVVLAVTKISDHLIETKLLEPFQENANTFSLEVSQVRSRVINTATMLIMGINQAKEDEDASELQALLENTDRELTEAGNDLDATIRHFDAEVRERMDATMAMLDIRNIINQAQELTQYARNKTRRNGLLNWRQQLSKAIKDQSDQAIEFITQRKEDIALAGFNKQFGGLREDHTVLRNFMEEISMQAEVEEAIPLYYRHLFSGKHLSPGSKLDNRQREVREARKAVQYIQQGLPGGILVAGESLSGKSFFTDFIANQLIKGKTYYITAPSGGATGVQDLNQAFRSACGRKTTPKHILGTLAEGAVFILNDIELWGLKAADGHQIINKIAELIKQYGNRHYFLLNGNIHALRLILKTTSLPDALVNTIMLPPLSKEQLKKVLWSRHQNGGTPLYYQGNLYSRSNANLPDKVYSRLFKLSGGNIGFAMRIWLASLRVSPQGFLTLVLPKEKEFPDIRNAELTNLMATLFLHKALSQRRLQKIYAFEGKEWVSSMTSELQKSMIVENRNPGTQGHTLSLRAEVRPYLEKWLKERELI